MEINHLNDEQKNAKKAQITIHKFKSCNSTTSTVSGDSTSTNNSSAFISPNSPTSPLSSLKLDLLPSNIKFELDQLELELLEGDITQKGYDKKRAKLLEPYLGILTNNKSEATSNIKSSQIGDKSKTPLNSNRTNIVIVTQKSNDLNKSKDKIRIPKKNKNRDDPNANRYHSEIYRFSCEIRQEAVKAALAMYSNQKQSCILASKRTTTYLTPQSVTNEQVTSTDQVNIVTNSAEKIQSFSDEDSSDEDENHGKLELIESPVTSNCSTNDSSANKTNFKREYYENQTSEFLSPKLNDLLTVSGAHSTGTSSCSTSTGTASNTSSNLSIPNETNKITNCHINQYYYHVQDLKSNANKQNLSKINYSIPFQKTDRVVAIKTSNQVNSKNLAKLQQQNQQLQSIKMPNHLTIESPKNDKQNSLTNSDSKSRSISSGQLNQSVSSDNDSHEIRHGSRVSAKIQQLLNTLKRPKRRPLNEYFEDNQEEVDIPPLDPAVPKPEGGISVPACGEPLVVPSSFPQSLEAAIHKFANASSKAICLSVLDQYGKSVNSITYVKLLSRAQKIAYHLLTKLNLSNNNEEIHLKQGDRVALVFPNNDPIGFVISFCACVLAGLVAIPIDVPLARRDAGYQSLGFLLGQVGASLVLTSELCYKALPKNSNNEMIEFKGWPRMSWIVIENLNKSPPKDWSPPNRIPQDSIAYIEYSSLKDGSVTGVSVTREQMLAHCQTLNVTCQYIEGEYVVCVLDYKREFGFWHGIQSTIFNGMHTIYIPYSIMKINPGIWLTTITKYKASVALVKSRDMHWGLMAHREQKDINLESLRLLLIADGANPWSLSSCDTFLDVFQSKGLKPEAICPSAGSSETLTLSLRRPDRTGPQSSGRGVLSMSGLSYGVVRVDQENSLTSLTLQDVGQVLPGTVVCVVKVNSSSTNPTLCHTDEAGEICISSRSTANGYYGLQGLTSTVFKVSPHGSDNMPIGNREFVRSGLIGFLGPGGLLFVCGSKEGLIEVSGRRHNTDDLIATVLAVEPMKFIYRGRIAVFSNKVLKDERIIIVAEQRPDSTEEECFQWMSRVLQAVDSIHHVGVYCLALVSPNTLPKTPLGGIHIPETRTKFLEGTLHPTNILMCPHTCVLNLPKPREHHPEREVGPSAVLAGSIVQGRRLAEAKGRDLFDDESDTAKKYQFLGDILRWRSATSPDHVLYTVINSKGQEVQKLTCLQLHKKAEKIACLLLEKAQLSSGDHTALIFSPGVDLICAFYACLYIGVIPVPIRPPHVQNIQTTLPTIKMIVEMSRIKAILTNNSLVKLFKSKEANSIIDSRQWPILLDIEENTKKKLSNYYRPPSGDKLCYLDFSVSTTGMLAGVQASHASSTALCRAIKLSCELYPSREVVLCLDPYSGLGFVLWCLNSVYSGHHSILVPPVEVEINPCIWLATVSHYKVRDTFCSYSVMELCTKGLRSSVIDLKSRGINLSCVRTCAIVAEERPRIQLTSSFIKLFQSLGLPARSVSTTFGCRANIAVCLQGASDPDPKPVYVDQRALRNDRVTIVEKGSPHSLCLLESGKLLPGVKVVIANPETKGQCADSHLGEIWVKSPHCSNGYYNICGEDVLDDNFNCHLATGDTLTTYARTGYLGFVRRIDPTMSNSEPHDAIYIVGSLDETMMIRGMRYHPIDIETTVLRSHKKICECACFTWTNLLVVVVELDGNENEALDLVPLVTNSVLEDHYLIVGVVVVVDPGVVPINSRGEKQRMHLRDGFLSDLLDPIYVAYNM
ncbi:unnamed protein product [Brachionus calyciflorus]|uniref:DMAP1-binding domain-containing protein n=1 Tax=Brachionus calyciflorus TaxID=104777 RepID=A0A813XFR7_9BILA|nr:unnamed protein product [Brachionus calyciflorus]